MPSRRGSAARRGSIMPHDPLQIALEHHRAGRLVRAEAAYRAILAERPDDADTLHWLGVLMLQAGQLDEAVSLLERAVARRPDDPAFLHNLGQAQLAARRDCDAVDTFTRARAAGVDTADLHFGLGVAQLRGRRVDEAIASFNAALTKDREHAPAYYHLAVAHRARNEPREVRKALNKAIEIDRDYAAAWHALGVLDREAGNVAQAAASFRKAEEVRARARDGGGDGGDAPAKPQSVAALERRLTPDESMRKLHAVLADAVGLAAAPSLAPEQVSQLFDRYADTFDAHLREKLNYRVPELIAAAVARLRPGAAAGTGGLDILDLGCGTGLCGPPLRPLARSLAGVDLSAAMIEKARERGVYDRLDVGDLVDALAAAPHNSFDLLVAADVLNYIGDLAPVMEAATAALRTGGLFVFTVEAAPAGETRFQLRPATHRYAHAETYVRHVAAIYGFETRRMGVVTLRNDAGAPVHGYLVALERPAVH
jgi:predicted TPR repeat methyltransferase